MDVEVISDAKNFAAMQSEWNALAEYYATPLMRHEWFAAAFDAFGTACDLAIHVVRDGRRLRAIAPFVIEHGLVRRLALLGHQAFEPSGILHDDADALQRVLCHLRALRLPLFAPRLAQGSGELAALARGPEWRIGRLLQSATNASASVPLLADWTAFEARMSSHSRSFIRRKRKIAERQGAVRVEVVAPREAEVDLHFGELVRVEGASWKGQAGTSLQRDPRMRHFCAAYAKSAAIDGTLRMFFLRLGKHTAAARMAVEQGGRLWEFKIGYDERFSACSPGILLTHETLHWACEHGLATHEFLGVAEPWQRWWPLNLRHYQNIHLYPLSAAGCITFWQDAFRGVRRGFARSMRAGIHRALTHGRASNRLFTDRTGRQ